RRRTPGTSSGRPGSRRRRSDRSPRSRGRRPPSCARATPRRSAMQRAMRIEVYPTDAEAFEAAAAVVAERLRAAPADRPATAAIGGERSARGVLVALAARGDVPWNRVQWCLADERCGAADDPLRHGKVARDSLFTPRGVAAAHIHEPPLAAGTPDDVAARYA